MKAKRGTARGVAAFVEASTIGFRLRGAEYHLSTIREIVESEILGKPGTPTKDRLLWHLASFYWELRATFDCTLQVVSAHHRLGLDRSDIRWPQYEAAVAKARIQNPLADKIKDVYDSSWFQDLSVRRDQISHWSHAYVQYIAARGIVIAVGTINQPDLIRACTTYVENMKELVDIATTSLPSGRIRF